mgnify:CR=1 FL=1|jgi:hypothetical protein
MKTEDVEYLDTDEEPRSGMLRHTYSLLCARLMITDGWMCFILACHAAITLGVV